MNTPWYITPISASRHGDAQKPEEAPHRLLKYPRQMTKEIRVLKSSRELYAPQQRQRRLLPPCLELGLAQLWSLLLIPLALWLVQLHRLHGQPYSCHCPRSFSSVSQRDAFSEASSPPPFHEFSGMNSE